MSNEINPLFQYETRKEFFEGKSIEKQSVAKVINTGADNKINLFTTAFLFSYNSADIKAKITNNEGNDNSIANDNNKPIIIIFFVDDFFKLILETIKKVPKNIKTSLEYCLNSCE